MPLAEHRASAILLEYHQAEAELIGKAVVLTDGKAGTVEQLILDEVHGLRLSVAGHPGKWPVSTINWCSSNSWRNLSDGPSRIPKRRGLCRGKCKLERDQ